MKTNKNFGLSLAMAIFLSVLIIVQSGGFLQASITSCSANISINSVRPNSQTSVSFEITNDGPDQINWVQLIRPSDNFVITNVSWSGSTSVGDDQATLYDGATIDSGDTKAIDIYIHAGETESTGESWTLLTSSESNGNDSVACTGNLVIAIEGERAPDPDTTPPAIQNIKLSKLKTNAITVSWVTDEPSDSDINYGETPDYGKNVHATAMVVNHSLELIGLEPDTSYHFYITNYDGLGNGSSSDDNTFLTPSVGSLPLPEVKTTPPVITKIPLKATPTEKIAPTISISTNLASPFKETPTIIGIATDNEALANVDYSLDGGKNWLQVNSTTGLGSQRVTFSITPQNLKDGNYNFITRAIDTSSNTSTTALQTIVIDRLPPTVGGSVVTVGSQVITPNDNNIMKSLVGVEQRITLSAVGGPINVTVVTTQYGKTAPIQNFNLTQSADDGLWSGVLSYSKAGLYQQTVHAIDGAGNITTRLLGTVKVDKSGTILGAKRKVLPARITIYTKDTETKEWEKWDSQAYDQANPATTNPDRGYGLYLPAGTYYLKVEADGYQTVITNSFTVYKATPVSADFILKHKLGFDIGPIHLRIPLPVFKGSNLDLPDSSTTTQKSSALESALPQFSLHQTNGKTISTKDLYGKPTILTFINTWAATASTQLGILGSMSEPFANVLAVSSGESESRISSYMQLANYRTNVLVDSKNELIGQLGGSYVPQTYFIDRHGIVKKVMVGVLSKEDLIKNIML